MEENRRFSLSDLLIKIILVIVFVLFAVWLLSLSNKKMTNSLDVLTDRIFAENMEKMKEVGKEYFTIERLPEKVGEMEVLTLSKMYEKKLLLELKDKNGNACSAKDSYISVEKYDNEYQMKVFLECGKESDYIIVIMGCYDYCDTDICEREEQPVEDEEYVKGEVEGIEYEYKKTTGGHWTDYGSWSEWSKVEVTKTDYRQVETKKVTEDYTYDKTVTETIFKDVIATCPDGYKKTADGTKCYKEISTNLYEDANCPIVSGYTLVSQDGFECTYSVSTSSSKNPTCPSVSGYVLNSQNEFTCNYSKTTTTSETPTCPTVSGYVLNNQDGFTCSYSKNTTVTTDPVCPTKSGWNVSRDGFTCNYSREVTVPYKQKITHKKTCYSSKDVIPCSGCAPVTQRVPYDCSTTSYVTKYKTITETATDTATCSTGYNKSGSNCVKTETDNITKTATCPSGYSKSGNTCVKTITDNITKMATCPSGYNKSGNVCVKTENLTVVNTAICPTGYNKTETGCVKTNTTNEYKELNKSCPTNYTMTSDKTKCYQEIDKVVSKTEKREVTYYRYRVREYVGGTVDYKWSTSKNDKKLLDAGYKLTGRTR